MFWWFWWSPGWVLVLVVPRVGSGTLIPSIIVPPPLITSSGVGLVVLVQVFVVLGVVLVVIEVAQRATATTTKKTTPQDHKNLYQDHQDHPGTRY